MFFSKFGWHWYSSFGDWSIFTILQLSPINLYPICIMQSLVMQFQHVWRIFVCRFKIGFPLTQGCYMCLVWLKLVQWLGKQLKITFLSLFCFYLPLETGFALKLNKNEFPSPQDAKCQVRIKLPKWLRRFSYFATVICFCYFNLELLAQFSRQKTIQSEKLTWAFGSVELIKVYCCKSEIKLRNLSKSRTQTCKNR